MIIVKITGGLGNQMFQYATARMLSEKHKKKLFLDISFYVNQETEYTGFLFRNYELDKYLINADIFDINNYENCDNFYVLSEMPGDYFVQNGVEYFTFYKDILDLPSNGSYILHGYWQSWKYFDSIKNILKKEFVLQNKHISDHARGIISFINTHTSVSIHIRRTDYKNTLGILQSDYYKHAIKYIYDNIDNPFFFIFSDDTKGADNTVSGLGIDYIMINEGNACEDQYIMSSCQHNIIANSTFSWWGAWLNNNKKKIVVAPRIWYQRNFKNETLYKDLIPKEWICF